MTGATLYMGDRTKLRADSLTGRFIAGQRKVEQIPGGLVDLGLNIKHLIFNKMSYLKK